MTQSIISSEGVIDYRALLDLAQEAAKNAYAPYSQYRVGAAILTDDGRVFTGVNVENKAISCSICAERSAAVRAVSEGARKFLACAVICPTQDGCKPCGICRQFLSEFGQDQIIIGTLHDGSLVTHTLDELLPQPEPQALG